MLGRLPSYCATTLALLACGRPRESPAADRPPQSSVQDSVARPDTEKTKPFNMGGMFFLQTSLSVGEYTFTGLTLGSFKGALWSSAISVLRPGKWDPDEYTCPGGFATRDTLDLHCPGTPLGVIRIAGHFLDTRGDFLDSRDVRSTYPIEATVSAVKDGRVVLMWHGRFILEVTD